MTMYGRSGTMGQMITGLVFQMEDVVIVAGIDMAGNKQNEYPISTSPKGCDMAADVIVGFTPMKAADRLLDCCAARKLPVVICTIGLSEGQTARVAEVAKEVTVPRSANTPLGVNLLLELVAKAAKTLAVTGFDMEIVEKHHNQRVDAPSGTALALADSLNGAMGEGYHYQHDRGTKKEKRDRKEVGIQSVRDGPIVGEHDTIFAGQDEVVTFSHIAYSKAIFAKGAIGAARFLAGKPAGLYNISDIIGQMYHHKTFSTYTRQCQEEEGRMLL